MLNCTFELNNKPLSTFKCGALNVPAFSGLGEQVNRRDSACIAEAGPIPPNTYYIFDRKSGGVLGVFRDLFNDRKDWFALYAIDGKIDDLTLCNKIKRGSFRLHPKGPLGISQGCITIESHSDFQLLRNLLKNTTQIDVPGTKLKAYGKVTVK